MYNPVILGRINFGSIGLDVYSSLDEPIFRASDIAEGIGYSVNNTYSLTQPCEEDEKLSLPMVVAGQVRMISFVTEAGLYNILAQSRKPIARKWRKIISDELIALRRSRNKNVVEQFDDWDHKLDDIYIDEETGVMMRSVTVQGGDVIQIPYEDGGDAE